ncbi:MAG TPA: M28 family peptidase, partial [Armatimonadota bacterium]|nr:M28 family peptidase [Armatimonadota bacterium]
MLFALAALLVPNTRSLYEGSLFYVRGAVMPPTGIQPVRRDGRYASLYDLVRLRNAERFDYILAQFALPGLSVEKIRIPNSPMRDLFVRFNNSEPLTVYCAHYDKLYEDPNYQGASDNTAAVSTLLAGIEELARRGQSGSRAFLFTGEEERGLTGATAFVEYARANRIAIRDIVNFDSLGRGRLTIRPSADLPGFVFALPFYG